MPEQCTKDLPVCRAYHGGATIRTISLEDQGIERVTEVLDQFLLDWMNLGVEKAMELRKKRRAAEARAHRKAYLAELPSMTLEDGRTVRI